MTGKLTGNIAKALLSAIYQCRDFDGLYGFMTTVQVFGIVYRKVTLLAANYTQKTMRVDKGTRMLVHAPELHAERVY